MELSPPLVTVLELFLLRDLSIEVAGPLSLFIADTCEADGVP